jgi:hypothetical protein
MLAGARGDVASSQASHVALAVNLFEYDSDSTTASGCCYMAASIRVPVYSSIGCPLMKRRSQATGSVKTSNSTQAPAAGRHNQTTGGRPSQAHVTDSHIRTTGGDCLSSHRWRHTRRHRRRQRSTLWHPGLAAAEVYPNQRDHSEL